MTTGSTEERPSTGTVTGTGTAGTAQTVPRPGTTAHPAGVRAPSPARTRAAARRRRRGTVMLGAADVFSATAIALAFGGSGGSDVGPLLLGPLGCGVLALNARAGLYRPGLDPHALDEIPLLTSRLAIAWCAATSLLAAFGRAGELSWAVLLGAIATHTALSCAGRALALAALRRADRREPRPALVVGSDGTSRAVAKVLLDRPRYGLRPVGFVELGAAERPDGLRKDGGRADTARTDGARTDGARTDSAGVEADAEAAVNGGMAADAVDGAAADAPLPVVVTLEDVARAVLQNTVSDVVFPRTPWEEPRGAELAALLGERGLSGWLIRPGCALGAHGTHAHGSHTTGPAHVWGFACRRLVLKCPPSGESWRKRLLDLLLVVPALIVAAPVLMGCALAVRFCDGPGVLFRQERIGLGGRSFTLLKFRTLRPADERESQTRWSVADDDRMSPVGRLLRRTSLDELPQLWNVLRGDMSLVGPRPERPYFVRQFSQSHPGYAHRHRAPAGLTGLAQVYGLRGDTSIEERARFDNHYIETWSLWGDVRIMCRTVISFFRMEGR
jgi:lipopolysaccharide/colanic/teichoic acid biosynthesis glycosyltransferase